MRDWGSTWRGVRAWRPVVSGQVNYAVRRIGGQPIGIGLAPPTSRWWLHLWTPVWHARRGPYVSIGLGCVAVYRGY